MAHLGHDDDIVLTWRGLTVTLALVRAFAAFNLSVIVVVGCFVLIAIENQSEIDTAMVAVISSVVTAWASYFAHLGGSDSASNGR